MVGHVENHSTNIGKDQYRHWDKNMNKLTDSLKEDRGEYNSQEKGTRAAYTVQAPFNGGATRYK
eukprot:3971611-Heterocapsa_arctica.AAC.1